MSTLRRNEAALSDTAFLCQLNGVAHNATMLGQLTSVLEIQIATIQDKQRIHSLDLLAQDTQTLAAKKEQNFSHFYHACWCAESKGNAWRLMRT